MNSFYRFKNISKLVLALVILCVGTVAIAQDKSSVARHTFTTNSVDFEPVDSISKIKINDVNINRIYYFSEILNQHDTTAKHVWYRNDKIIFEREINIKGYRWRATTNLSKSNFKPGDNVWVEVVAQDGTILATDKLIIE